ncbi:aldo/keto reductase [Actinoplanes sp. TBRC 11911]|uniref:aldo/keto reductase n=1 Tax=Actinoplanes sp. TBRC 11911 TaxID=2729386 RepID=UPI00145F72C8|nr:aldo/keto reductase [Actinoplanes sp. TBRC 11911]NMO52819.1 aldo/keto reductase [Actinoplanes sp. TBRC 11911]
MQYRQLGRSGLRVSAYTLGTMGFGGTGWAAPVGNVDVDGAREEIAIAKDAGVNMIDTADSYSDGLAEEILGKALGASRDQWLISTKVSQPTGDTQNDYGASRYHIIKGAEGSLRRLGTDYIDVYYMHGWDGQTRLEETLGALDELVRSGKVRYIGCSNYGAWQMVKALGVSDANGWERFAANQIYYSIQGREAETDIVPASIDQGVGVTVWSPLAGGLLSGKYRRGVVPDNNRRQLGDWGEPPVYDEDKLYDTIEVIVKISETHGVSPARVALAYTSQKPGISSLIVGARTPQQLRDNLASADLVLTAEEIKSLDEISKYPLPYPYWHQFNNQAKVRWSEADRTLFSYFL